MTRRVVILVMALHVAFLVCDMTEKGTAWGQDGTLYAQGGTGQRTADTEDAVRAQFLDSVKRKDSLADEKEHWFKIYMGLGDTNKRLEKLMERADKEIEKSEGHIQSMLRSQRTLLNDMIERHEFLRALAVEQYALLLKLEKLEEQNQRKGLGKGDYLQEKRMLLDEINRVEQERFWKNLGGDLRGAILSLEGAIHDTAREVERTAGAVRSIPPPYIPLK